MFIGLDQSLTSTGIAVLPREGDQPVLLENLPTGKLRGAERLRFIVSRIDEVLREYKPEYAALEGYSYGSTGRVFELGEAGGVVKLTLFDHKTPYLVVPPASLKKFVSFKSEASKEDMAKAVFNRWKLKIDQDDACDAYGLARVARALVMKNSTVRPELEVLRALTTDKPMKLGSTKGRTKISL